MGNQSFTLTKSRAEASLQINSPPTHAGAEESVRLILTKNPFYSFSHPLLNLLIHKLKLHQPHTLSSDVK